jgi:cytochrome c biogenesis protein CcmG/thiol:disulfide interchange protein DsbE
LNRWIFAVPVVAFAVIAFFLFRSLVSPPPEVLPSVLIDKPAPQMALPAIDSATPSFASADLAAGHVTVINFFASWCIPCRSESEQLMALSRMPGITLYGVDYEERQPGAGRAFLDELGNPFSRIADDGKGRAGIDWGVYGVPETYVVDGKGIVRFKLIGPLTSGALQNQLLPQIEKAKAATGS